MPAGQAAPPRRPAPDPGRVIAGWAASGVRSQEVAAAWACDLQGQDSGGRLESSMKAAERYGAGNSTAVRARNHLMGAGMIRHEPDHHYYVA